jgi:hypothetical protein
MSARRRSFTFMNKQEVALERQSQGKRRTLGSLAPWVIALTCLGGYGYWRRRKPRASSRRARPVPAGNAIYDVSNQTRRRDMDPDEQQARGEYLRGTLPSSEEDRSHQPHTHEMPAE